ncbi:MAG: 1,4-dihydroxy-2-naphthoate octaprenyltransferase [Flavobacteriaceae bacterium]|nr:1,4-dihydroxy-2-naphthoate octaprenyltransferase [Flavobacteriaceae bacterium]
MENIKPWISAFRLRTLPLSVSGIIVGSCMAYYNGFFQVSIFIFAVLTTLSLQVLSNLANDYGDGVKGTDNQDRIGPERAIQSGKITPEQMFNAIKINILIVILLTLSLIYSAFNTYHFLYSLLFFVLALICIYAAVKYTVGSTAYGYRALGDIMVFLFFGLISVMGTYFLFSMQLDHVLILPACIIGLLSAGVLNLNNMRDIESDKTSNKITIAVKLGINKAKIYHLALIISAMLLSILFTILYYRSISNLVYMVVFIPLIMHTVTIINTKEPKLLDPQLKVLALSTFALALLLGIGHIYNAM